jgi:hypothetical protein
MADHGLAVSAVQSRRTGPLTEPASAMPPTAGYDAIWPDEAPAAMPPEPPLWLMASTRSAPSWQSPAAGCCQDLPGRSSDEHLLGGGYLGRHGRARLGGQHQDRGARSAGRDRRRRAGREHPRYPRARYPDRCRGVPGQRGLAGADVPGRGRDRSGVAARALEGEPVHRRGLLRPAVPGRVRVLQARPRMASARRRDRRGRAKHDLGRGGVRGDGRDPG